MNGFETIRYEIEEGIATITLNRPDRLNAMNPPMMHELLSVLDRTDRDDEVRAVVFTGSGRAFCECAPTRQSIDPEPGLGGRCP
jgi:enoyl-CoA hydratase/carnithine racemase